MKKAFGNMFQKNITRKTKPTKCTIKSSFILKKEMFKSTPYIGKSFISFLSDEVQCFDSCLKNRSKK